MFVALPENSHPLPHGEPLIELIGGKRLLEQDLPAKE